MAAEKKNTSISQIEQMFHEGLQKAAVDANQHYLVGVSGGKDSVFLATLLRQNRIPFSIAHFNHSARESAGRDQAFVQELAGQWQINFYTTAMNVPAYAQARKCSFEEAARILRYQYFFQLAEQENFAGVIVGHQADDQVETVLMHFLRGSGIAGLAGMAYREMNPSFSSTVPLLRPMLNIWREQIDEYCATEQLAAVEDETNQDVSFYRNRLRHELLPLLQEYNPGARVHIWQTSMILQETQQTLEQYSVDVQREVMVLKEPSLIQLDANKFHALDSGLQKLLVRQFLGTLMPDVRDFGYDLTLTTLTQIHNPPESRQWEIMGEIYGFVTDQVIILGELTAITSYFQRFFPQWQKGAEKISLYDGFSIQLNNGFEISVQTMLLTDIVDSPWKTAQANKAWVDLDSLQPPIMVRSYQQGDVFMPYGMGGQRMKLSDYFVNQKIPKPVREYYPLLCDQQGILWVVGERIADRCKINAATRRIVRFSLNSANN